MPGSLYKPVLHKIPSVEGNLFQFWADLLFLTRSQKKHFVWLPNINEYLTSREYINSKGLRLDDRDKPLLLGSWLSLNPDHRDWWVVTENKVTNSHGYDQEHPWLVKTVRYQSSDNFQRDFCQGCQVPKKFKRPNSEMWKRPNKSQIFKEII